MIDDRNIKPNFKLLVLWNAVRTSADIWSRVHGSARILFSQLRLLFCKLKLFPSNKQQTIEKKQNVTLWIIHHRTMWERLCGKGSSPANTNHNRYSGADLSKHEAVMSSKKGRGSVNSIHSHQLTICTLCQGSSLTQSISWDIKSNGAWLLALCAYMC